jgi:diguanylate cyclase (GGDEF)-like protein/putative nucleotidyltransferase with HDIG domain
VPGRRKQRLDELQGRLTEAQRRLAELERELEVRSLRDPLTGLPNLAAFDRWLHAEVERSRRYGRPLTVAVLDVDGFRAVNANQGRALGDEVLATVGRALAEQTRASDLVTRSCGDEFLVALPETTGPQAVQAFQRLLLELEVLSVGPVECISVSVGVAEYQRGMTASLLIGAAGELMEEGRAAGGGRVKTAAPRRQAPVRKEDGVHSDAIMGLAGALNARDPYTGEHSEFVVELAAKVARGLALDEREVQRVRAAAQLHDIGKVAIPDEILNKKGPLEDREWKVMRQHPVVGERILRAIPGLGAVARIVRHEHERWDGKGYPDGLRGNESPVGSRIILACDAYHAMTSDRPYRRAMSHAEALRELAGGAGTQFDPQVTEVLIGCLYGQRLSGRTRPTPRRSSPDPRLRVA